MNKNVVIQSNFANYLQHCPDDHSFNMCVLVQGDAPPTVDPVDFYIFFSSTSEKWALAWLKHTHSKHSTIGSEMHIQCQCPRLTFLPQPLHTPNMSWAHTFKSPTPKPQEHTKSARKTCFSETKRGCKPNQALMYEAMPWKQRQPWHAAGLCVYLCQVAGRQAQILTEQIIQHQVWLKYMNKQNKYDHCNSPTTCCVCTCLPTL